MSFNFMAAITICSDFGAQKNKQDKLYLFHEKLEVICCHMGVLKKMEEEKREESGGDL